ncbi:MAG: sigma-54 interaction domain-containing protein [Gammaproteobacteria bacterium]
MVTSAATQQTQRYQETDRLLALIEEGTATAGEEFMRVLVRCMAQTLNARYAFICEYFRDHRRVRDLAFWAHDRYQENGEYDIAGTPCEYVLAGDMKCYPCNVARIFPAYSWLKEVGAESYLAVPLKDRQGQVLGHLGIMDNELMELTPPQMSVFQIFAARAGVELQRMQAEKALKKSEQRLAGILATAMDAIIAIDAARRIVLFNVAAERTFNCASTWAVGQPFDRFLSKRFRSLLDGLMREAERAKGSMKQVWVPDDMAALRADGEEFPIEATISPLDIETQRLYTIILRDVNERKRTAAEMQRLQRENVYLQEQSQLQGRPGNLLGESAPMQRLLSAIATVAPSDSTVLIGGETGSGKELAAHAIHALSSRKDKLLVVVNCAALPAELIESELFGHEKGAFTGATTQRKGRFELADGGTIFLDELGELTAAAQAKLLRVLQEQEFERVGGDKTIKVNVRVIAATNRELEEMVGAGKFRADLYYRLNVFPLRMPPLRERIEDIPILVDVLLKKLAVRLNKPLRAVSARSLEKLKRYAWPGNVRELQNIIERAALLSMGPIIEINEVLMSPAGEAIQPTAPASLEEVQRRHILGALERCAWVVEGPQGAARLLGLKPSTLRFRMQKLGISKPRAGVARS